MYILDLIDTCKNPALSTILPIVKNIMFMIQIIVPIVLLIMFTVQFVELTINPELKDGFRKVLNKLIAAIIIFFIPILINVIMGAVGESTEFSNCWNNAASAESIWNGTSYIEAEEEY